MHALREWEINMSGSSVNHSMNLYNGFCIGLYFFSLSEPHYFHAAHYYSEDFVPTIVMLQHHMYDGGFRISLKIGVQSQVKKMEIYPPSSRQFNFFCIFKENIVICKYIYMYLGC